MSDSTAGYYSGPDAAETPASNEPAGLRCRICGNPDGNRAFEAREMMFGSRERFDYVECDACGSLQLRDVPPDLSPFYPPDYYSFDERPYTAPRSKRFLKRRLARHLLGALDPLGAAVAAVWRTPQEVEWARRAGLGLDASILDVGAGGGQVLLTMRDYGFSRLLGVDPFLDADRALPGGIRVRRAGLHEVDGAFDLVMFHHSLEHVPDPGAALRAARRLLKPGGSVLVRMPVVGDSWRTYGADWVELDPPRHLHVMTVDGFRQLAARAGLEVYDVAWDATGFELRGSEQYRRDVPLDDPRSHDLGGEGKLFSDEELAEFEERAEEMNRAGTAGRAAYWLREA